MTVLSRLRRRRRLAIKLLLINLLLWIALFVGNWQQHQGSITVAVAKGQQLLDMVPVELMYPAGLALDVQAVGDLALADSTLANTLAGRDYDLLNAVRLTAGEVAPWKDRGCAVDECAYVTIFNYTNSQTVEAVVNLNQGNVVAYWSNDNARPAGSRTILDKAVAIAAANPDVQAILGDIGAADPLMVPMSGWLVDDDCRDQWCVDLTFYDPAGSGRIVHVFVNLEQEIVARTFYTRGRADRVAARPQAQRNAFTDGCHEEYDWDVCWEMTANDGINFRDATFNGQSIFTSVKIGQIEAWYPSWPGGYRDEIGFAASVPPFEGTEINDLEGEGFEIRQLFTEFERWPNCICCYRYEEIMRFYADGRFELRFVSHGPGCDELSVYRPFWRIDLDLDGAEGDEVWLWEENQWVEVATEGETFPFVNDLSPDGKKVATFDGDLHYRWSMERTDPLGLDEGHMFFLAGNDQEGEGPIMTGPGDTYIPPRQYINGDDVSGEDVVLWFVPLLTTKKSEPYWCMPDPEPAFSPCTAILSAVPGGELQQPTAEELAESAATNAAATPMASAIPPATPMPAAVPPTPRPIEGGDAETIILNAGCGSCHAVGSLGEGRKVGPDLSFIGLTADSRVPEMAAADYIRQSILEPNAYLAPACPNGECLPNIMPQDYVRRLTEPQIDAVVGFLLDQQGLAPTPDAIGEGREEDAATRPTPLSKAVPLPTAILTPRIIAQILLVSVVIVISLFLLLRK